MCFKGIGVSLFLLFLSWGPAAAAPAGPDCRAFTDQDGDGTGQACFNAAGKRDFRKAAVPGNDAGLKWNWIARTWVSRKEGGATSNAYFAVAENFVENMAADVPGDPAAERRIHNTLLHKGYAVSLYAPGGARLWTRMVKDEGEAFAVEVAGDGSVAAVLTQCVEPGDCSRLKGKSPPRHRLAAFGQGGRRLMNFPPRSGICDLFGSLWMSGNGEYILLPCGVDVDPALPYILRPKNGLLWHADKVYRSPELYVSPAGDTDEDTLKARTYPDGQYVQLPLLELDWTPVSAAR